MRAVLLFWIFAALGCYGIMTVGATSARPPEATYTPPPAITFKVGRDTVLQQIATAFPEIGLAVAGIVRMSETTFRVNSRSVSASLRDGLDCGGVRGGSVEDLSNRGLFHLRVTVSETDGGTTVHILEITEGACVPLGLYGARLSDLLRQRMPS